MGGTTTMTIILVSMILFQLFDCNYATQGAAQQFKVGDKAIFVNLGVNKELNGMECEITGNLMEDGKGVFRFPVRFVNHKDGKTIDTNVKPINLEKKEQSGEC